MTRSKLGRQKVRTRAWNFGRVLKKEKVRAIVRKCLEEMKERWRKERKKKNLKERERKDCLRDIRVKKREEGEMKYGEIKDRDRGSLIRENWENIEGSRYNK